MTTDLLNTTLARIATECFLRQTYARKELLILNDGPVPVASESREVREVHVRRLPGRTLGELRNLAFSEARGEWLIQWDDDDWYGPDRIVIQMKARRQGTAILLRRQLRYSFKTGSAFVMATPEGLHGTILHERAVKQRYPKLAKSEDTVFVKSFSQHVTIDNDPVLYVRFHHGFNTWDEPHIMRHLAGELDSWELDARQQSVLSGEVLPNYTGWLNEASCVEVGQRP